MRNSLQKLGIYLSILCGLVGCNYERNKEIGPEAEVSPVPSSSPLATASPAPVPAPEPKFSALNKTIFSVKCLNCHNFQKAAGEVNFANYRELNDSIGLKYSPIVPKEPQRSGLVLTLESDKMPPGNEKLTAEQKNAVRQWILNGAADD